MSSYEEDMQALDPAFERVEKLLQDAERALDRVYHRPHGLCLEARYEADRIRGYLAQCRTALAADTEADYLVAIPREGGLYIYGAVIHALALPEFPDSKRAHLYTLAERLRDQAEPGGVSVLESVQALGAFHRMSQAVTMEPPPVKTRDPLRCPDCLAVSTASCCDFCGWEWDGGGSDPRHSSRRPAEDILEEIRRRRRINEGIGQQSPHPLATVMGTFGGEEWDALQAEIRRQRGEER